MSNSIRQELAKVVQYELHRKAQSIGERTFISFYLLFKKSIENCFLLFK